MILNCCRGFLYFFLFWFSVVLLTLTAYHVHFTESLSNSFYVPIVVELMVSSCIGIILSAWFFSAIVCRFRCGAVYWVELSSLAILWTMNLVGAAIITRGWPDLTWCLGAFGICRLIDAIVSYAWITWAVVNFLFALSLLCSMGLSDLDLTGSIYKRGNPSRPSTTRATEPQMPEPQTTSSV